ncbi:hypothetical protein ACIOHS_00045 [Streptomyces sp. NPDC088253]|uniref:hypothetical protein n=1 Tax=Streptomyces sp. NPDC088253 TaxID=3365846 RepID=UPI00380BC7B4
MSWTTLTAGHYRRRIRLRLSSDSPYPPAVAADQITTAPSPASLAQLLTDPKRLMHTLAGLVGDTPVLWNGTPSGEYSGDVQ